MRPLSLETFAAAEVYGCGLDLLVNPDPQVHVAAWAGLYALLSGISPEEAAEELVQPGALEAFTGVVQQALDTGPGEERPNHRRTKDPREKIGVPGGSTMKSTEGTDYAVLLDLSRFTHIPLGDIYQMTFRGLSALSENLRANPPKPSLF